MTTTPLQVDTDPKYWLIKVSEVCLFDNDCEESRWEPYVVYKSDDELDLWLDLRFETQYWGDCEVHYGVEVKELTIEQAVAIDPESVLESLEAGV